MLKSFFHTGFVVKDLESSVGFYQDALGLEVVGRYERHGEFAQKLLGFDDAYLKVAFLSMGNGHALELIQYVVPPSVEGQLPKNALGASHLAFYVEGIDQLYDDLGHKGMQFTNSPATLTENGRDIRKALYAQDPDGNWLEFVELLV